MRDSSLSPSSRLGGAVISDRIVSALLEELRTGRYAQTDRLPAEVDLAAELGVSRTVIRDALSEMERAGYIERVRGIGTVVNRSVLNLRSRLLLTSSYSQWSSSGPCVYGRWSWFSGHEQAGHGDDGRRDSSRSPSGA